jgi:putative hydrolase of the HAD superfamily
MPYKFILFDLDQTLYPSESGLQQEVGRRIQNWVSNYLKLSWDEAYEVRKDYYTRYGTTLNGLLVEREIDASDYLAFVHDIPVETYLGPDVALDAMLDALPLRRVVYTNATTEYSWRVLRVLGIDERFERVISIEDVGLRNKLYRDGHERALTLLGAQGNECIMVEDSVRNLKAAKALGMTTLLVRQAGVLGLAEESDGSVDHVLDHVLDVGPVVTGLLNSHS